MADEKDPFLVPREVQAAGWDEHGRMLVAAFYVAERWDDLFNIALRYGMDPREIRWASTQLADEAEAKWGERPSSDYTRGDS